MNAKAVIESVLDMDKKSSSLKTFTYTKATFGSLLVMLSCLWQMGCGGSFYQAMMDYEEELRENRKKQISEASQMSTVFFNVELIQSPEADLPVPTIRNFTLINQGTQQAVNITDSAQQTSSIKQHSKQWHRIYLKPGRYKFWKMLTEYSHVTNDYRYLKHVQMSYDINMVFVVPSSDIAVYIGHIVLDTTKPDNRYECRLINHWYKAKKFYDSVLNSEFHMTQIDKDRGTFLLGMMKPNRSTDG